MACAACGGRGMFRTRTIGPTPPPSARTRITNAGNVHTRVAVHCAYTCPIRVRNKCRYFVRVR